MTSPIILQRHTFAILLFGATLAVSAQIPNGGFEIWSIQDGHSVPDGWLTYNDVPTVGGPTVEPGAPGHPGSLHAVITTRPSGVGASGIQGWISAGNSTGNAGFPFAQRPGVFIGQWQYAIQPSDTGQIQVAFSKWNGSSAEPVGFGILEVTGTISSWQPFSFPITWLSGETPDTAYIQIVSSINFNAPVVGSTMKVDDLAFSGSAGISGQAVRQLVFTVHPIADDVLQITSSETGELQCYDAGGRLMATRSIHDLNTTISIPSLPKGLVLYRFIGRDSLLASGKWMGL